MWLSFLLFVKSMSRKTIVRNWSWSCNFSCKKIYSMIDKFVLVCIVYSGVNIHVYGDRTSFIFLSTVVCIPSKREFIESLEFSRCSSYDEYLPINKCNWNLISKGRFPNWRLQMWTHRIEQLLSYLVDYRMQHTYREGNRAADWLANKGSKQFWVKQLTIASIGINL